MYTLGLDTIAGSKLLQLKFSSWGLFQPERAVLHDERRARFIGMGDGAAIIRHCGDDHPIAVSPESLSLPPAKLARPDSSDLAAWRGITSLRQPSAPRRDPRLRRSRPQP